MKTLMKGNEALAEGAIRAGCRFFSGYPITPQSEILEYLSWRMPEVGGHFVQTESELAGINMVFGAAAAGFRAMTSSSGPGFTLKQEGISYLSSMELPAVVVDVMRYGIGLGDIALGQSDYLQAVKGGGHGGYRLPVLATASAQESVELVATAFDIAEKHRTPVILLSDGAIGQMAEAVEMPDFYNHDPDKFPWALKGKADALPNGRKLTDPSYYTYSYDEYDPYLQNRYQKMWDEEQRWEEYRTDNADMIIVSYGISARIAREAIDSAREAGHKVGLIRPISLWPFPQKALEKYNRSIKGYVVVEMSICGQMSEDVKLLSQGTKVVSFATGRKVPTVEKIMHYLEVLASDNAKEI